ncbi:MAG: hypothetical protein AAGA56_06515, partial [Myxococcota bacterium]
MFRNSAFLLLGLGLIVLQSNFFRLLTTVQEALFVFDVEVGLAGATPSLLLFVIVFMGVHEYSMTRGVMLSVALGYFLDVFSAAPIGLFSFTSVLVFAISRMAGIRLAAQTKPTRMGLALVFSLLEGGVIVVLTAILGGDTVRSRALAVMLLPSGLVTALFAPLVFGLAE